MNGVIIFIPNDGRSFATETSDDILICDGCADGFKLVYEFENGPSGLYCTGCKNRIEGFITNDENTNETVIKINNDVIGWIWNRQFYSIDEGDEGSGNME